MTEKLYDILAVNMETNKVSIMGQKKTLRNAEAIENMAVIRRGVNECFFVTVETGKFNNGDEWTVMDE